MNTFDVAVIGWGKGGKTLAGTLARAGKKVAMIEQSSDMYGGACINVACIPTKALIHNAETRTDHDYDPSYFATSVERRDNLTAAMRRKNYSMLAGLDTVVVFDGKARFSGPKTITVSAGDDELDVTAETIIINTGSSPNIPSIPGAEVGGVIHTSITLQHAHLPKELVVVGGGYIGIEFASMFAQYGSEVTVIDRNARPLSRDDEDVAAEVASAVRDTGVKFINSAQVVRIDSDEASATVTYTIGDEVHEVRGDAVLLALGRHPNTAELNLESTGVSTTEKGAIEVDEFLETSVPGIYALGDVNGGPQFTYVSLDDNRIVQDQLLGTGKRSTKDRVAVASTAFTTPPFSRVGLSETQAREQGLEIKVAKKKIADIAAMPRPKIVEDPRGLIKIIVDAHTDAILGAALFHVDSQEVINLVSLAMRQGVTATVLRDSIYTHPSSSEALNEVLGTI